MDALQAVQAVVAAATAALCAVAIARVAAPHECGTRAAPTEVLSWWGIALGLTAAVVNSVGTLVQKLAHNDEARAGRPGGSYLASRRWWLGFGLITASEVAMGSSYGFAPAAVVAPMGSTTVVASTALAVGVLDERLDWRLLLACVLIVAGTVLLAASTPAASLTLSDRELARALLASPRAAAFLTSTGLALLALRAWSPAREGLRLIRTATLAALVSSWTVVAVRGVASMLAHAPDDCRACGCASTLASPTLWFLLAVTVFSAFWAGGVIEQRGIARYDQTQWVPVHFCVCALLFSLSSALVYGDRIDQGGRVALGAALSIAGVILSGGGPAHVSSASSSYTA